MYTEIHFDISYLTKIPSKVVLRVKMQKNQDLVSSQKP